MNATDLIKKVRAIEIKTRKIVHSTFTGEYHSVFKGQGLNFAEVAPYEPGHDIRLIDWKVTARTGSPHIKKFEEERELTVMIMIDVSASGAFGSESQTKIAVAAEIAAVLGFSANNNNDRVGLMLFTDKVEQYTPPKKGKNHILRIIRNIFDFKFNGGKTNIAQAIEAVTKLNKKPAIIFLISDFIDHNYEKPLQLAAKRHDVVPIIIEDPRETTLPKMGIVPLEDEETGAIMYINTSSTDIRQRFRTMVLARKANQNRLFKRLGLNPIEIDTSKGYIKPLATYFKQRAKRY